ncbi:hypothetical protein ACROYT_G022534 [Oculina patagonica]
METELNESFQFVEANLRSKLETVNILKQAHNSLEQCTNKKMYKGNEKESPESLALQVFNDQLPLELKEKDIAELKGRRLHGLDIDVVEAITDFSMIAKLTKEPVVKKPKEGEEQKQLRGRIS